MTRHTPAAARAVGLALIAAVALVGCSSSSPQALDPEVRYLQPGLPGEPNTVLTQAPAPEVVIGSAFTDVDASFMQDMQVHHRQALAMTAMVGERTDHEDLKLFVRRMDISQQGELEQLDTMLGEHEAAVKRLGGAGHGGSHSDGTHGGMSSMDHSDMPGMLTEAELAELEAARGDEFVRLFLLGMSKHHGGALQMVDELLSDETAGADPRLFQFAQHVDSDQRIEIDRMARMWDELPPV